MLTVLYLLQVSKAESEAMVMLRYKVLIEKGRQQFQKELESIMPEVKLGGKRGIYPLIMLNILCTITLPHFLSC